MKIVFKFHHKCLHKVPISVLGLIFIEITRGPSYVGPIHNFAVVVGYEKKKKKKHPQCGNISKAFCQTSLVNIDLNTWIAGSHKTIFFASGLTGCLYLELAMITAVKIIKGA